MTEFWVWPLAAALTVALVAGPLGCFVVWRRMAYFGDALAHSALLGVTLGFAIGLAPTAGVALVMIAVAALLVWLQEHTAFASDTLLGILAHLALALGIVLASRETNLRVDLLGYLFGDVLAVGPADFAGIAAITITVGIALALAWRGLLASVVHGELAAVEGVRVVALRWLFVMLIAALVAVAMRVVGMLLITALLILPGSAARALARTPEGMALIAAGVGVVSVLGGLAASFAFDWPSGPTIVLAAGVVFVVMQLAGALRSRAAQGS